MRSREKAPAAATANTVEEAASALGLHLQAGGSLTPVPTPGLTLPAAGETAYADVVCATARYYATTVSYQRGAGYFEDHPAFGRRWVPNRRLDARRRREAEAEAREQWRDHAWARVVLTNAGIRINPAGMSGVWLPFDHVLLSGITVEPARQALVLSYSVCAPLLLTGPAVPWLAVAIRHLSPETLAPEGGNIPEVNS